MRLTLKILALLFCVNWLPANAQKISSDSRNINTSSLFVHFDKNVYINTEDVWFTAYILQTEAKLNQHNTLYVSVVNRKDSTVVLQGKFIIQNGFSFGSINLPDSISSGNYNFVVNTNIKINNQPELCFMQPFIVKSSYLDPLEITASLRKNYGTDGSVLVKAISKKNHFAEKVKISYSFGGDKKQSIKGVGYTNTIGELLIKYPLNKIDKNNNTLQLVALKDKTTRYSKIIVPVGKNEIQINKDKILEDDFSLKFYPEGGYIVDDLVSVIGVEAKKGQDVLLKTKIVLYKNEIAFDTVATNSSGMGSFKIKSIPGFTYSAKILNEGKLLGYYPLPVGLKMGCVLTMPSIANTSKLNIQLQSKGVTAITVLLHNNNKSFLKVKGQLNENSVNKLSLDISNIPVGLTILTILDSLNRPLAERLFFAHQNKLNNLNIDLEKEEFKKRDSVSLKIYAKDFAENQLNGKVSVASINSTALLNVNKLNILDYSYLDKNISDLAINYTVLKVTDSVYLSNLLLIKYWRKYKWAEYESNVSTKPIISEIKYEGKVLKYDKEVKSPEKLMLFNLKTLVKALVTDSAGNFTIDYKSLITPPDKDHLKLSVLFDTEQIYSFKMLNPFNEINKWIGTLNYPNNLSKNVILNSDLDKSITAKAIKLKDVTITNNDGDFLSDGGGCPDFVCPYNILNCINHVGDYMNTKPKLGGRYLMKSRSKETLIYTECISFKKEIDDIVGIHLPKEYYTWNVKDLNEPLNFSTIYWNYQVELDNKKATTIKFYTGDIAGNFKIIVQGVTDNGIVYGEKDFKVMK